MATFKSAKDIYHACEKVRDAGYTKWESYTPFPLHGLDKAMGMTRSNVPRFTLIGGLTGFTLATLMVWFMNAYDYPLNVGGKPFFSFIFYDAVHNYCEGSQHANMKPFQPAIAQCARFSLTKNSDATPYVNRYNNAAHFLDQEAAKVIKTLKQQKLLDNTIIVITADHGEQHNDQKMGYWSHASAYTPYQLHIPMLVYWPGKPSTTHSYFATNFDVAPTIMQNVLNCSNPSSDYSVGTSLFNPKQRPYLIAGSYTDYAFIEQNKVTRIYPGGDYIINDKLGRHINRGTLDVDFIKQAQADLDRYFH